MSALNVPEVTIEQCKDKTKRYLKAAISKNVPLKQLRSSFWWSLPGIGKSQVVKQIAKELQDELGVTVELREVRLGECTIFELLGLMKNNDDTVEYIAPPIYKEADHIVIYLFDEMDKAQGQLLVAALNLVLDHKFWAYELPENSFVIAAGNPDNMDGQLFSCLKPELNNRFRHYSIKPDFNCWEKWAKEHDINHYVLEYLESQVQDIYDTEAVERDVAFPTPRSWAAVSDYLNLFEESEIDWDEIYSEVAGDIGQGAAYAFISFCETNGKLPSPEKILRGKIEEVPRKVDYKHAIINALLVYMKEREAQLDDIAFGNACAYINRFPVDYQTSFYTKLMAELSSQSKLILFTTPEFEIWKRTAKIYV